MPRIFPQICTSSLNTNIRFVTPLNIQPMHPSGLFKTGGVSAPLPSQGWDYRDPKSHSTLVPSMKGKPTGSILSLPPGDDEDDKIRLILESAHKGKDMEKDSSPAKKQWTSETTVSHPSKCSKPSKAEKTWSCTEPTPAGYIDYKPITELKKIWEEVSFAELTKHNTNAWVWGNASPLGVNITHSE